jgi:hypothetical protein
MSAILLLEDGRGFYRSNIRYCRVLQLIAGALPGTSSELRAWLQDKAERPSPFCEFDIRALSEAHRADFWGAAERALAEASSPQEAEPSLTRASGSRDCLVHLLRMHHSIVAGEPPFVLNDLDEAVPFSGVRENLQELWGE